MTPNIIIIFLFLLFDGASSSLHLFAFLNFKKTGVENKKSFAMYRKTSS